MSQHLMAPKEAYRCLPKVCQAVGQDPWDREYGSTLIARCPDPSPQQAVYPTLWAVTKGLT